MAKRNIFKVIRKSQEEAENELMQMVDESSETTIFKEKIANYVNLRKDLNDTEKQILTMILVTYFTVHRTVSVQEVVVSFKIDLLELPKIRQAIISMMIKQYLTVFIQEDNHIYHGVLPAKRIVNSIIGYADDNSLANPLDIIVEISIAVFSGMITHKEFHYYLDDVVDRLEENHTELFSLFMSLETSIEQLMLSLALRSALYEDGLVYINDFAFDIFKNADESSYVIDKILSKSYKSIVDGIFYIEEDKEGEKCFKLSGKYITSAFGEGFAIKNATSNEGLIEDENLTDQGLFFSSKIAEKTNLIQDAIMEPKLQEITTKLKDANMMSGITILLSGAPGTGKTALAKDLAYKSGRQLFFVSAASIRGKYVGESEKNTQKIFEDYRRAQKRSTRTPILLFNEADGLLGKRIEGVESSTDQMNNSMQNILLEEFERFEGILIATTNLAGNLDSAFDRRFLFSINLEIPDEEERFKIWKSKLPHFDAEILKKLSKINIAGGDITKTIREYIIGESVGLYKQQEDIFKITNQPKVQQEIVMGFKTNK